VHGLGQKKTACGICHPQAVFIEDSGAMQRIGELMSLGGGFRFPPNGIIDFLTMDSHVTRCIDADAYFVPADFDYGHADVITNDDRFVALT
jgi:hypothetical protein